ncbi:hypothetical protein [Curtobacterium flaccumfaciens]|uniref:hypothetical protein n=1 Tax=Curtobacterium flaccumfaciens TaxID=2035 RepID=UPI003417D19C
MTEVDLEDYEEPMPEAWTELIKGMSRAGSDRSLIAAAQARLDVAVRAHQIAHDRRMADQRRIDESALEDRREAFASTMKDREEAFQNSLDAREQSRHDAEMASAVLDRSSATRAANALNVATWVLALATIVLVVVTATHGA